MKPTQVTEGNPTPSLDHLLPWTGQQRESLTPDEKEKLGLRLSDNPPEGHPIGSPWRDVIEPPEATLRRYFWKRDKLHESQLIKVCRNKVLLRELVHFREIIERNHENRHRSIMNIQHQEHKEALESAQKIQDELGSCGTQWDDFARDAVVAPVNNKGDKLIMQWGYALIWCCEMLNLLEYLQKTPQSLACETTSTPLVNPRGGQDPMKWTAAWRIDLLQNLINNLQARPEELIIASIKGEDPKEVRRAMAVLEDKVKWTKRGSGGICLSDKGTRKVREKLGK